MKVTNVGTYLIDQVESQDGWSSGKKFLFVKLETDEGLVGWGEAYAVGHRERAIEEIIRSLGRALVTLPEASPRGFRRHIAFQLAHKHPGFDFSAAASALEIALWDLWGKKLNAPLHRLLGGALVDRVPLYANTWSDATPSFEALAERCLDLKNQGFQAVKIYPMKYPTLDESVECLRQVREAVGPTTDIMIDLAVLDDPKLALQAARLFEAYAPYWFEEPLTGEDLDALAELRGKTDLAIVTGERQCGKYHFRDVLQKRAADILNPDIAGAGGILEMLEIAAMAEAHSVKVSPHCWNSPTVAFAAMIHVCAVMPNALAAEYYSDYVAFGNQLATCDYDIVDGQATLPKAPGLGVDMNEALLVELAAK